MYILSIQAFNMLQCNFARYALVFWKLFNLLHVVWIFMSAAFLLCKKLISIKHEIELI